MASSPAPHRRSAKPAADDTSATQPAAKPVAKAAVKTAARKVAKKLVTKPQDKASAQPGAKLGKPAAKQAAKQAAKATTQPVPGAPAKTSARPPVKKASARTKRPAAPAAPVVAAVAAVAQPKPVPAPVQAPSPAPAPAATATATATATAAARPPKPSKPSTAATQTAPKERRGSGPKSAVPDVAVPAPPPAPTPAPTPAAPPAAPLPACSSLSLRGDEQQHIVWQPGQGCPPVLAQAVARRLDDDGCLPADDASLLPLLQRLAQQAGHRLTVAPEVWALRAATLDALSRLQRLESAYADGPASAALQTLLSVPLPLYQAEGALWAVVAGRALLADEHGLGKGVQAIAAAQLWRQHFGLQRVAVLCPPAQRMAWHRAWQQLAGQQAQVLAGSPHQRQSQWTQPAELRIFSPEALASDATQVALWAPELMIIDEPQRLALQPEHWQALQRCGADQALVLCGAPLDEQPLLLDQLVDFLDRWRQGPLAALRQLQVARESGQAMDDARLEQVSEQLSRLLLQRGREDLVQSLPAQVLSRRLLPLAPAQREAHDQQLATLSAGLAGWQHSGYLSQQQQSRLGQTLRAVHSACWRIEPGNPASALAGPTVLALQAVLDELLTTGAPQVALPCATLADQHQLGQALHYEPGLQLLAPGDPVPATVQAVLHIGVPWQAPAAADGALAQQWLLLSAQGCLDEGLFAGLDQRAGLAAGLAEADGAPLQGPALQAWLTALAQAVRRAQTLPDEAG